MRTRNGRRKVLFGTNYPMIFHEPALADRDALAFGDEARELYLSANAQRLFEGGPRRLLCLAERERAGRRSGARNGRAAALSSAPPDCCIRPRIQKSAALWQMLVSWNAGGGGWRRLPHCRSLIAMRRWWSGCVREAA
jgi:hypothetical protein